MARPANTSLPLQSGTTASDTFPPSPRARKNPRLRGLQRSQTMGWAVNEGMWEQAGPSGDGIMGGTRKRVGKGIASSGSMNPVRTCMQTRSRKPAWRMCSSFVYLFHCVSPEQITQPLPHQIAQTPTSICERYSRHTDRPHQYDDKIMQLKIHTHMSLLRGTDGVIYKPDVSIEYNSWWYRRLDFSGLIRNSVLTGGKLSPSPQHKNEKK